MKPVIIIAIALIFVIGFFFSNISAEEYIVKIGNINRNCEFYENCFIPMSVKIGPGDSVTWITRQDPTTIQNTTSGELIYATLTLSNPTYTKIFNQVGTFEYIALTYPWMKGEVVVREYTAHGLYFLNFTTPKIISPPEPIIEEVSGKVPDWVKNNAKWWSEGLIDDSEFVSALEFLIKTKIIEIEITKISVIQNKEIPDWVRNNAKWWSEGLIPQNDFLSGIKYIIEKGIINVSVPEKTVMVESNPSIDVWKKFFRVNQDFIFEQQIKSRLKAVPDPTYSVEGETVHAYYDVFVSEIPSNTLPIDYREILDESLREWELSNDNLHFRYTNLKFEGDIWVAWVIDDLEDRRIGHATIGKGVLEVMIGDKSCNGFFELYDEVTVKNIMLHELGHAVGLLHNENDKTDLMYPTISWMGYKYCQ